MSPADTDHCVDDLLCCLQVRPPYTLAGHLQVLVLGGDHTKAQATHHQPRKPRRFIPGFDHYTGGGGGWVCATFDKPHSVQMCFYASFITPQMAL